jgi:hypothetical protein
VLQVDDGNDQAIDTFNATYFKNSLKTEENEYDILDVDELQMKDNAMIVNGLLC